MLSTDNHSQDGMGLWVPESKELESGLSLIAFLLTAAAFLTQQSGISGDGSCGVAAGLPKNGSESQLLWTARQRGVELTMRASAVLVHPLKRVGLRDARQQSVFTCAIEWNNFVLDGLSLLIFSAL